VTPTTVQQVGGIDGAGSVTIFDGATLTADHIVQSSLAIGAGSTFMLAPSDVNGAPMGGGLALANSLTPTSAQLVAGTSLIAAGPVSIEPFIPLGGAVSAASVAAVPEPASSLLLLLGAISLWPIARRKLRRCG
jgi:hypothetical protein